MEINSAQQKFEGWAIVNVLGHQQHCGMVTTEYYGGTVLFRVATPELPARELVNEEKHGQSIGGQWIRPGHKVALGAVPASERLIGAGSIYSIEPCSHEKVLEHMREHFNPPVLSQTRPDGTPFVEEPDVF